MLAWPINSTPTGYDTLDGMIQAIPSYCLLLVALIASCLIFVRLRRLLDLCGKGLDEARVLHGPDIDSHHTLRSGADQQHSTTTRRRKASSGGRGQQEPALDLSKRNPIDRRYRGNRILKSLSFRPRRPDTDHDIALSPISRKELKLKPTGERKAHIQPTNSVDWLAHLPETHRPEAQHLYRGFSKSVASQLMERTNERGRSEISRQFPRLPTARKGGVDEPLESWREIGNMADDWDDLTQWEEEGIHDADGIDNANDVDDADSQQESDEESMGSIVKDLKTLSLDQAKRIGVPNVRHDLRRPRLRGGGDGLDSGPRHSNPSTTSESVGEEEQENVGSRIEDLAEPSEIFDYDTLLGLSRYPSEARPPFMASVSDLDSQRDVGGESPDPSFPTVYPGEFIRGADPLRSRPGNNEAGGGSQFHTARSAVYVSREVSRECDEILSHLDATYQHMDIARQKLSELVHRSSKTDIPLLRHIVVSNNELLTRQTELANLKTYVRNLRNSVEPPNGQLVDEVLGFMDEEERGYVFGDDDDFADDEAPGHCQAPIQPQRSWGWRPMPKAVRPRVGSVIGSNRGRGITVNRGRPHIASSLLVAVQGSPSTSFETEQLGQMLGNERPTASMGEGSPSSSAREFQRAMSQNPDETYSNRIGSSDSASQPGAASNCFADARSRNRRPLNHIGRLCPLQAVEEPESEPLETSRRPCYSHRDLSHGSTNGMRPGRKRPGYSRPRPRQRQRQRDSNSPARARRIPTPRATRWRDSYSINGRMADARMSRSRRRMSKRRSGGGGGPWPWPGPGGPIPDPVAPPYA